MKNLKDIIIELREVYHNTTPSLSYGKMVKLMEENGDYLSESTLSRLFGKNWEKYEFSYESTIGPVARILLNIEKIEDTDDLDIKAMKHLLIYKIQRIEELESIINKEREDHHKKLEKEREQFNKSIEFLKHQVELKDKRMDMLFEAIFLNKEQHNEVMNAVMSCPFRKDED